MSGDDRRNATSSIESQLAECRHYAEQRGYTVVGEAFEEPDKHTSSADWLPELDKLLQLSPLRTFNVVVCREVDRLARNRFKQLATEIELENHGVRSLDELASQKTALDKQIVDLGLAVASLRAEAEPLLMTTERIETIEAMAAEIRIGATLADNDKQAQRAIFQLLDVHVTLNHEDKQRWADVTCCLGSERVATDNNIVGYFCSAITMRSTNLRAPSWKRGPSPKARSTKPGKSPASLKPLPKAQGKISHYKAVQKRKLFGFGYYIKELWYGEERCAGWCIGHKGR